MQMHIYSKCTYMKATNSSMESHSDSLRRYIMLNILSKDWPLYSDLLLQNLPSGNVETFLLLHS